MLCLKKICSSWLCCTPWIWGFVDKKWNTCKILSYFVSKISKNLKKSTLRLRFLNQMYLNLISQSIKNRILKKKHGKSKNVPKPLLFQFLKNPSLEPKFHSQYVHLNLSSCLPPGCGGLREAVSIRRMCGTRTWILLPQKGKLYALPSLSLDPRVPPYRKKLFKNCWLTSPKLHETDVFVLK